MAKRLTVQFLNSKLKPGRYYDFHGTGLHLHVRKSGSISWSQKLRFNGKQIELGLGGYPNVSLAQARSRAAQNKQCALNGDDPRKSNDKPITVPTFKEVADEVLEKVAHELSNAKHRAQWRSTLETYVFPKIGNLPIDEVDLTAIETVLKPIWYDKTETASRVRGRIEKVLDTAIVRNLRQGPNPAVWRNNLETILPSPKKIMKKQNHPALQLNDVRRWWAELQTRDGIAAKAMTLLTLAACRSNEIRGMIWSELTFFDQQEADKKGYLGYWTIPAERMKAGDIHRVPIIPRMIDVLVEPKGNDDLVFPSPRGGKISDMTLSALMKRMHKSDERGFIDETSRRPAVPHGLRSTFRVWAAENGYDRDVAELQLAHKIGNATELAYNRSDILDRRAVMLNDWATFLDNDA